MHRKFKNFLIILIIFLLIWFVWFKDDSQKPISYTEYTVMQNDTLWSILGNDCPVDVRQAIYITKETNKMDDVVIYPGQTILIPVWEDKK